MRRIPLAVGVLFAFLTSDFWLLSPCFAQDSIKYSPSGETGTVTTGGAGTITFPTGMTGTLSVTGITIIQAANVPGANAGAELAGCIGAVPAMGGICDARSISGTQSINQDIFASAPAGSMGKVIFGTAIYTVTATSHIPWGWEIACEPEVTTGQSYLTPNTGTTFINTTNNTPTFFAGGTGGTANFRIHGCAFDGSGTGSHITLSNAALGEISNNFIRGKTNAIIADNRTYNAVYWVAFRDNVFISTSDNILWESEAHSTTVEFSGNWFRHDDAGYHSGRGINVVTATGAGGFNGKINRNQFSGNTDDSVVGLAMILKECTGVEISGNDFQLGNVPNSTAVDAGGCYGLTMSGNNFGQAPSNSLQTAITAGDCDHCTFFANTFSGPITYQYAFTGNSIGTYVFGATPSAVLGNPKVGAIWYDSGLFRQWENDATLLDNYFGNVHQINLPSGAIGGLYILRNGTGKNYIGVNYGDDSLYIGRSSDCPGSNCSLTILQANGVIYANKQVVSNVTTGSAPLAIASTTPVANLSLSGRSGGTIAGMGSISGALYKSTTVCASSASPAVCGAAPTGAVAIANPGTTIQVNTTAITANSQVFIMEDSTLGTALGVTCNTTLGRTYQVTGRSAGTSFTITASATPASNSACLSYWVIN